jgi:hypothetical protein
MVCAFAEVRADPLARGQRSGALRFDTDDILPAAPPTVPPGYYDGVMCDACVGLAVS